MTKSKRKSDPNYKVGYKRPPVEHQFKPGQRANPNGRPRGSVNMETGVERVLRTKIPVRKGDKTQKVSMLEAIAETYARKAVQGDRLAAGVVINLAAKSGAFRANIELTGTNSDDGVLAPANTRPSDELVESLDRSLLSKAEQIDLSRLAELIDLGGDVTALSDTDFKRLKQIVNKGRGKDVTPKKDDASPEISA